MYIITLQAIALYLISQYLHRSLSFASRTLYIVLMLPGTIAHETCHAVVALLMGARITKFSIIPSGDTLGHVEYTSPKIPLIGNVAISIAPLIGCPAILLLISGYFGVHFDFPPASFDIFAGSRFLLDGTLSFITGLDYLNWKTYVFLYLALTLGAGAAPSKTDIISMLPGLIVIVAAVYSLNYFGVNIQYLYNVFSWLSTALSVAMIPLLVVTIIVGMLKSIAILRRT
ncbi:MAG TPA: M50 family metallopeptidase [Candidatus Methanoperedens sp.]|nr:M50 family metallopeptidase [Candidatus Methanoperedens sp.]